MTKVSRASGFIVLIVGVLNCGGGGGASQGRAGAAGGAASGGSGPGGAAGGAGGGASSAGGGTGGAVPATVGDLIPPDADIYCLTAVPTDQTTLYGYERACTSAKRISGSPVTTDDRSLFCRIWGGAPVDVCPASDPAVASCSWTVGDTGVSGDLMLAVVRVIVKATGTPDAFAVVRGGGCSPPPVYDTAHHVLKSTCTGTFTAKVNGVPTDLSQDLECRFVTDGQQALWGLNANLFTKPQHPFMQIMIRKDATGVAFGAIPWLTGIVYQHDSASSYTLSPNGAGTKYQSEVFDDGGRALKGTFTVNSVPNSALAITDGVIDLKFEVK